MRPKLSTALVLVLVILCGVSSAEARRRHSLPKWDWGLSVAAGGTYDDNVLGFSERDQNAYLRDQGSFPTPLETVDDLESQIQLKPSLQWRAPMTLMVTGEYRLKCMHRIRNSFSDYQTHSIGLSVRPRVSGYRWIARVRVLTIPSYYLRVYRDRDWDENHAARYENWDYEGTFRYNVHGGFWIAAGAGYGTDYYNHKFTEYDSEYRDYLLGVSYDFISGLSLDGTYTRRLSDNVGSGWKNSSVYSDLETDPFMDSEYGDAGYSENDLSTAVRSDIPWIKFVDTEGSLGFRYRRRVYTTDRYLEDDPIHRGRLDHRSRWTASLTLKPSRVWNIEASFAYESRRTSSDWPSVPLAKNFIRREIGLLLTYKIR